MAHEGFSYLPPSEEYGLNQEPPILTKKGLLFIESYKYLYLYKNTLRYGLNQMPLDWKNISPLWLSN